MTQIQAVTNTRILNQANSQTLDQQLEALILDFRDNPENRWDDIQKMQTLLFQNQSYIEQQCVANGWSNSGQDPGTHYSTFLDHVRSLIQGAEEWHQENPGQPMPAGSFDAINEDITQLHWLMTTKNP